MENNVMTIKDVRCYIDEKGTAWLNAADVARGWGFTRIKGNTVYIMWDRVNQYLKDFGFHTSVENSTQVPKNSQQVGKDDYLPENIVYRLGFKASNKAAEKFQIKLADEVLPALRKTGTYSVAGADNSPLGILKNIVAQFEANNARMTAIEQGIDDTRAACATMYDQVDAIQDKLDKTILNEPPKDSMTLMEVAAYLGIYSEDGNPHAQMAGAIARECGIKTTNIRAQDSKYSKTMIQIVGGVQQLVLFIKPAGWKKMCQWWEEHHEEAYTVLLYKRRTVDKNTGEIHEPGDYRDCFYNIDGRKWHTDQDRNLNVGVPF